MIDNYLIEHEGLPHVLDLAVHLVNFFVWVSQGDDSEPLLLLALLPEHSFMLKSLIIVSAKDPLDLTLGLWTLGLRTWA